MVPQLVAFLLWPKSHFTVKMPLPCSGFFISKGILCIDSYMKLTHSRAAALMVLVTLMWSTAGVVTRQLASAHSFEVTFWRSFFTVVALLIILPAWQGRAVFSPLRNAGMALWLSGICWSVMFTAFMVALTLTTVANVLVTMAIGPLLTAVIARVFIGHQISARTWLAIGLAGVGIAWMYGQQIFSADFSGNAPPGNWAGTLVALLVPLAAACNWTVVQHRRRHAQKMDMVVAVWVGAVVSTLVTLPLALPFSATPHDVALLALLGIFQLAIPCVLSVLCAGVLKAPEVSLLGLLEVIFGILLAWVGAGEVPGNHVLTGGALVIVALGINELWNWKQKA